MKSNWTSVCGFFALAALCSVQATFNKKYYSIAVCECNGRSKYCLRDSGGLHCVDCTGNTQGRHCERCKDGFFLNASQPGAQGCTQCLCNTTGSVNASCDSSGRCLCKEGVSGDKCDSCSDGPIGPGGCRQSRRPRQNTDSQSECFCFGHSNKCSRKDSYYVHKITSDFDTDTDGWKAMTSRGVTHDDDDVHFRWSPKHQDLELISSSSLPVYLLAPAKFLGEQQLSFGQSLSFSLRLDRGVRHPSVDDVILVGGGLKVSASLGDLRSIVPCGKKINYSFRLDNKPDSKWKPKLSHDDFRQLLQNLTAIKIRGTFGDNGRGYLDNVQLVSARRHGDGGAPIRRGDVIDRVFDSAPWVQTCDCPTGYTGDFCQTCAPGYTRTDPTQGPYAKCTPCKCKGGSCDALTGDCYSNDQDTTCPRGFYPDPYLTDTCHACPCAYGATCSLRPGAIEPQCDNPCPIGTTGSRCDKCSEGYYGDPLGLRGIQRPCRLCQCGSINTNTNSVLNGGLGSCDPHTGQCVKCPDNRDGFNCEDCREGYYKERRGDGGSTCLACNCDPVGSASPQCNYLGDCRCRRGWEGLKCQRSNCPACFAPIKAKLEAYADRLAAIEALLLSGGGKPTDSSKLEAALKDAERLVDSLEGDTNQLNGLEKELQVRLSSVSKRLTNMEDGRQLKEAQNAAKTIKDDKKTYKGKVDLIQGLIRDMKNNLKKAQTDLNSAERPVSDAPSASNIFPALVKTATGLATQHEGTADTVQQDASSALADSKEALSLVRNLQNRENKVKELVGDLKTMYDKNSAQVKGLESQSAALIDEAKDESKMADGMLKEIAAMQKIIPPNMKAEADALSSQFDTLKVKADKDIADLESMKADVQKDRTDSAKLLKKGQDAKKVYDSLVGRVDVAKDKTQKALDSINGNAKELDDTLNALRGFDQQIADNKKKSDAAIKKLPGIQKVINEAVGKNSQTEKTVDGLTDDLNKVRQNNINLDAKVDKLKETYDGLPSPATLLEQAKKLNVDSKALKTDTDGTGARLEAELDAARKLKADAQKASGDATASLNKAKQAKGSVADTLKRVNDMLANLGTSTPIDETRLKRLEDEVSKAKKQVNDDLQPRLKTAMEKEDAFRRRLQGMEKDLVDIDKDIKNLQEIREKVPTGCLNTGPIEEA